MSARALFVCFALAVVGCRAGAKHEESESEIPRPAAVAIAAVREGDIEEVLRVSGETSALSVIRLASPIAGRVTFLSAQPGDRLAARETAARLLPLESEAALVGFRALDRAGALSPGEQETARKLESNLAAREVTLSAPFPAVVAERLKNPGEQVSPGDVVLELYDPHSLVAVAQVPIDSAGRLRKGMAATVLTANGTVRGEVATVLPSLAAGALTVPVRLTLSSPLEPPLRNAAVDCEISIATHHAARLIPRSAIVATDSPTEARVLVASEGHARSRKIGIGIRSHDLVEVLSGLEAGEPILVEGQYGLADGAPIRPQPPEPPAGQRTGDTE